MPTMNGYLVAYPDGTRISKVLTPDPIAKNAQYGWNAGMCCGLPVTKKINDVGFLLKVISAIASKTPVDLRRVYMTGISNGGMMAYAMAAEASDHVAAISSISGQVEIPVIHPTRSVPTMEFHSVNDPIAKFDGTPSKNPKLRLSVMEGIDQWVKADGCQQDADDRRNHRGRGRLDFCGGDGDADHLCAVPVGRGSRTVAVHRIGTRLAGQHAQHGPQEDLDPGRCRTGHHPGERQRDDVAILREVLVALQPEVDLAFAANVHTARGTLEAGHFDVASSRSGPGHVPPRLVTDVERFP
jgi:dienelactone hydrolase